jgi:hypothetical protein
VDWAGYLPLSDIDLSCIGNKAEVRYPGGFPSLSRCALRHSEVREEEADRAAPAEQDSVDPLFESRRAVTAGVVFEAMRERACCSVGADVIEGKA